MIFEAQGIFYGSNSVDTIYVLTTAMTIINLKPEWLTLKDYEYKSRPSVVAFMVVPNWKIAWRLL